MQVIQLLRFCTTFLTGILLGRIFQWSTSEIASFEVLLFIGNMASFFWLTGSTKSLLSVFPNSPTPHATIRFYTILTLLIALLAGGILVSLTPFLQSIFDSFDSLPPLWLVAVFLVFNAPSSLTEYIYLITKQEKKIIPYGLVSYAGYMVIILSILFLQGDAITLFKGLMIWACCRLCWLIGLFLTCKENFKKVKSFNKNVNKNLVSIGSLSLYTLIGGGMEYIDGFIVGNYFVDSGTFAIFRYGAKELPLATILAGALAATLIPQFKDAPATTLAIIKQKTTQLSRWLYPLTMMLMAVSPWLFPFFFGEAFQPSAMVFNVYLLLISSRLILPQVLLYANHLNRFLITTALVEVFINISLSLILVRIWGLTGIALATVIAYLASKLMMMFFVWLKMDIRPSEYINIRYWLRQNVLLFGWFGLLWWWMS